MSRGAPTLVLYMARKFAGEIAEALLAAGRGADEPAAIVANAARADQQVIVTTLGGLAAAAQNAPALAIMVIGENVALARELSWLANSRPLEPFRQFFHHRAALGVGHFEPAAHFLQGAAAAGAHADAGLIGADFYARAFHLPAFMAVLLELVQFP